MVFVSWQYIDRYTQRHPDTSDRREWPLDFPLPLRCQ